MKYLLSFFISLLAFFHLSAQDKNAQAIKLPAADAVNTYAVIIGIANYENENINLNYANRDAQVFADYLRSKAGGAVPEDHIRLLIDTTATTAAIYNALNWLRDQCELNKIENEEKPCLVYFYFSGHGDVETDTRANLGFLLSFNTPPNNYINNAIRIEDLNHYAHTLSIDMNANVVIITDACHSGKLAGNGNQGNYLVGKELSTAREKEIRIASCLPSELSNEDERWGGGRGVFSYYLVNGLKGLADQNSDHTVTLNEIKKYVDSSIAADPVIRENKFKQTPVLEGNPQFRIASVNAEELAGMEGMLLLRSALQTDEDYFFDLIKKQGKLESIDYTRLSSLSKDDIPFAFLEEAEKKLDTASRVDRIEQLTKNIRQDSVRLKSFNEKLVELLHTQGQKIINLYLEGDAAELERRRYYNSKTNGYDIYPAMYAVALKLVEPSDPLAGILKINQLYFTGVAARLQLPLATEAEQKALLAKALEAQNLALALEDNAAYIQNELGILYQFRKEYGLAEKYYTNATLLAPGWAIPRANLCGLYVAMKDTVKAKEAGEEAEKLQPGLQLTNIQLGLASELSGNLLFAEEFYRTAIDINSRHFIPFERLGYVYLGTTQYAWADSFFYEADLRKRGYHFQGNKGSYEYVLANVPAVMLFPCDVNPLQLLKDDIMGIFNWGMKEYFDKHFTEAIQVLKKIIAIDKKNPLAFHYLGKIFYEQGDRENAELMFKFALTSWLDSASFRRYCDSLVKDKKYPYDHACFEDYFRKNHYSQEEDYYFLATLYEGWAHFEEAEYWYRKIIAFDPGYLGGYAGLWQMMEKQERYTDAEKVIIDYTMHDKETTDRELNSFYRRAISKYPDNADWYYRLGMLLYERCPYPALTLYLDTIIYVAKTNQELFIDSAGYSTLKNGLTWDINIPGSPRFVELKSFAMNPGYLLLPGIKKIIRLAEAMYTPRRDAIIYLQKADSLEREPAKKADINFKIANVFIWAGSKKQAYPYYKKSVELEPNNASARLQLIDVCDGLYRNRTGLEQLTYLYDQEQINFPKRMLYAKYSIHAGDFKKAGKLLGEARNIYPFILPELYDLTGRMYFMSHQPAKAIPWYNDYLKNFPDDPSVLYSLARLYAESNNKAKAWTSLESAMKNGFNYAFVLNTDATWERFRKDPKWSKLLKKYPVRTYYYPENLEP